MSASNLCSQLIQLLHEAKYHEILQLLNFPAVSMQSSHLSPVRLIPLLFISGLAYFRLSNFAKAKKYFERCERSAMNLSSGAGDVAICNVFLGDIECAVQAFTKAAGHYKKAIKMYTSDSIVASCFKLSTCIPTLSGIHLKLGDSLKRSCKSDDAISQYKTAIQEARRPRDELSAHMSLGNMYFSTRKYANALEEYTRSSELAAYISNPYYLGKIHENMTHTYLRLNMKNEAIYHFQKSVQCFTGKPRALYHVYHRLGSTYESMNDLNAAEEYYSLALKQATGGDVSSRARLCDKISNVHLIRGRYEEAIPRYTEILHLSSDPKTTNMARLNRGYAYLKLAMKSTLHELDDPFEAKLHGPQCDLGDCLSEISPSTKELYAQGIHDLKVVLEYYEWEIKKSSDLCTIPLSFNLFAAVSKTVS